MRGAERDYAVVRVLNDLEALRRLLRLHPATHPSLQPARERLRERVLGLGADGEVVTASFHSGRLFWDGEEVVVPPIMPAARLAPLFFNLGLAAVRLTLPAGADGAIALATTLAGLHDPPGESDRRTLLARAAEFAGVELVPIDVSGVQLLGSKHPAERGRAVRAERLSGDAALPLDRLVHDGRLDPGSIAAIVAETGHPDTLVDHLFGELAESVRDTPEAGRAVAAALVREYLAEIVRLLDPERRALAVVAALRHLPLASLDDSWVDGETLLDAVERMLTLGVAVPDPVRRALDELANPSVTDRLQTMPDEAVIRARHLLSRLPLEAGAPPLDQDAASAPRTGWMATAWAGELVGSLTDEQIKLHLVSQLREAITLWPDDGVSERAAVRLADEFVDALELEDVEMAARLAPLLAATRSEEVARLCNESGVPAAVRALGRVDKAHHAAVTAILVALGARSLPAILKALEEEESFTARRCLLEVVTRHGRQAVPYLRARLDDPRWFVARNAVFLLRRIGDADSLPFLRARLAGCHPRVLAEILTALVSFHDPGWLGTLAATLDSDDEERGQAALAVAARIRHPDVTRTLLLRLDGRIGKRLQEPLSLELIRALGALRDPEALPALQRILALKQWRYAFPLDPAQRAAAGAIARLDSPAARKVARALAAGKDRGVADAVRAAMESRPGAEEEDGG